jgi:hypothetical protein
MMSDAIKMTLSTVVYYLIVFTVIFTASDVTSTNSEIILQFITDQGETQG